MTDAAAINFHEINNRALANLPFLTGLLWGGRLPGKPSVHVLRLNPGANRRMGRLVMRDERGAWCDLDGNCSSGSDLIEMVQAFASVDRVAAARWLDENIPKPPPPDDAKASPNSGDSAKTVHEQVVDAIQNLDAHRDERRGGGTPAAPYPPSRRKGQ